MLTLAETDEFIGLLELAITAHLAWTRRVLRCAVLRISPGDDVLDANAHRLCAFGMWLASQEKIALTEDPVIFEEIVITHTLMHDAIRNICHDILSGAPGTYSDLLQFEENQGRLLKLLSDIKDHVLTNVLKHDPLTGMLLRHSLEKNFDDMQAISKHTRNTTYLILVDLDHFKVVNDTYGHLVGDMVLREVAAVLQRTVRSKDQIYRYGGEEFLLLLAAPSDFNLELCMNRLLHNVSDINIPLDGRDVVNVTVTIGATAMLESDKLNDSILRADTALYWGKENGRNMYKIFK